MLSERIEEMMVRKMFYYGPLYIPISITKKTYIFSQAN
jgi:hypothetical protein